MKDLVSVLVLSLGVFSGAAFAEDKADCPKVISTDGKAYSQIQVKDIDSKGGLGESRSLDLSSHKGKVTVLRFYGTWCPHCKRDIQDLDSQFGKQAAKDEINLVMVSFLTRKEGPETLKDFMNGGLQSLKADPKHFEWMHAEIDSNKLKELKNNKKEALFPGYLGVPYGLVFDQKGQLRFQGHFTFGDEALKAHYQMIEGLVSGKCS